MKKSHYFENVVKQQVNKFSVHMFIVIINNTIICKINHITLEINNITFLDSRKKGNLHF